MSRNTSVAFVNIMFTTMRSERLNALGFTPRVVVSFKLTQANCYPVSAAVLFAVSADSPCVFTFASCAVSATTGDVVAFVCSFSYSLLVSSLSSPVLSTSSMATLSVAVAVVALISTTSSLYPHHCPSTHSSSLPAGLVC